MIAIEQMVSLVKILSKADVISGMNWNILEWLFEKDYTNSVNGVLGISKTTLIT